jgi:hypothetical protein
MTMAGSKPTTSRRNAKQKIKKRYSKAREDAQLADVIPTTSEGAVRNEVVNPATQGSQPLPRLISQAIRNGWATPDDIKPRMIDELIDLVHQPDVEPHVKVGAARTLIQGDQVQYERDHPEAAARNGGAVATAVVNVGVVANLGAVFARINEQLGVIGAAQLPRPEPLDQPAGGAAVERDNHGAAPAGGEGTPVAGTRDQVLRPAAADRGECAAGP